jgi:hypothetical protein
MKFVMVSGHELPWRIAAGPELFLPCLPPNRTHSIIFAFSDSSFLLEPKPRRISQNSAIVHRHPAPSGKIPSNACLIPLTSGGGQGSWQPPKKVPGDCYPSMHPSNISPSKPLQQETAQNPLKQLPKSSPAYIPLILKFTPVCGVPASDTLTRVLKLLELPLLQHHPAHSNSEPHSGD